MKPLHPFPARMAPEIALKSLQNLPDKSTVLDPMSGSATVLRQASFMGHNAFGFDLDPLSVLMGRVATTKIDSDIFVEKVGNIIERAKALNSSEVCLPWIDEDDETQNFINFWFADKQQAQIRKLVYLIETDKSIKDEREYKNAAKLALSRIIVSKEQRASLARDTSHSRPHRVARDNDFDVYAGLKSSADRMVRVMTEGNLLGRVKIYEGDARNIHQIADGTIDAIVTSPPYLNAIDYLRGHKMALVWFGFQISQIRQIRKSSIGAERALSSKAPEVIHKIARATGEMERHAKREKNMIIRFARDMFLQLGESERVLKQGGTAIYVVGNSCLRGNFIENSEAVVASAEHFGMRTVSKVDREIPPNNRYLPMPSGEDNSLGKRMRTETILSFEKVA